MPGPCGDVQKGMKSSIDRLSLVGNTSQPGCEVHESLLYHHLNPLVVPHRCAAYHPEERPDLEHEVLPAIFNLQEVSEAPAGALDEDPPEHLICPITQVIHCQDE